MVNYFAEPPEQSDRSVLSDLLKKIPSNASLSYIDILNIFDSAGFLYLNPEKFSRIAPWRRLVVWKVVY